MRDVVRDLVLDVCSSMMDYEPVQGAPGACIGCGVADAAFSQCLSCGAPVEPTDGSWHFDFGWLEGPRCAAGDEVWVLDAGPVGPSPWSVRGVVTQVWVVQGGGDRSSRVAVDLGGGYSRVVSGRDVRLV